MAICFVFFFFQAEDGIRDLTVTGVQTCALPISPQSVMHGGRAEHSPQVLSRPWMAVERSDRSSWVVVNVGKQLTELYQGHRGRVKEKKGTALAANRHQPLPTVRKEEGTATNIDVSVVGSVTLRSRRLVETTELPSCCV